MTDHQLRARMPPKCGRDAFPRKAMNQELRKRRSNIFRLEGEYWTIVYDGDANRLRDSAGLRYLAYLLQRPGGKVAAAELTRMACTPNGRRLGSRLATTHHAELARVKATRAIRAAMQRIGMHDAPLNEHLRATIRTGVLCSYAPDPRLSVEWEF